MVGVDPITMLTGPVRATLPILTWAALHIDDIGAFEVNKAFTSVPLAWEIETGADHTRVNPLGGAIADGHPIGGHEQS